MLKVFLVEDEFVVREGIKRNVDWAGNGYEFCGEAGDGERAFPMIQRTKPDIVITDIKMPFMDGLELSRLIKAKMPQVEIIILSGYSDFEYAKEAIKLGVAEYITKPINSEELLREIGIVAKKIEDKRQDEAIKEKYRQEMEENTNAKRRKLFNSLVTGNKSMHELLEQGEKLGVDLMADCYNIVLFKAFSKSAETEVYEKIMLGITELIQGDNVLVYDRDQEGIAVILKGDDETSVEMLSAQVERKIEEYLADENITDYFGGIGEKVSRMSELPSCFEKAGRAFAYRYFINESKFQEYDTATGVEYKETEEFDIFNIDTKQIDRSKVTNFLKQGENNETKFFVDEFVKGIGQKAFDSMLFRQYIVMDVYFCIMEFVQGLELDRSEIVPPDMTKLSSGTSDSVREYLEKLIGTVIKLRNKAADSKYRDVVDQVKKYIDENYADENLSLNEIAKHVCFSPNHLSTVFAQETGQTFIKYLTDYRINLAKDMLRCTGYKSSEISVMVGYKDPHYFSFLFKKTIGMTPTQYREGKN